MCRNNTCATVRATTPHLLHTLDTLPPPPSLFSFVDVACACTVHEESRPLLNKPAINTQRNHHQRALASSARAPDGRVQSLLARFRRGKPGCIKSNVTNDELVENAVWWKSSFRGTVPGFLIRTDLRDLFSFLRSTRGARNRNHWTHSNTPMPGAVWRRADTITGRLHVNYLPPVPPECMNPLVGRNAKRSSSKKKRTAWKRESQQHCASP